ncbi:AAA family ATPase [Mesorhizobium sp. M0025]|uniref:AAA family ATPase n=1 Tax=Mesorhizobium sp. M0025 TaxID=2956846 RepID=UPI003339B4EB
MEPPPIGQDYSRNNSQILWEDGERIFRRGLRSTDSGEHRAILMVELAARRPSRASVDRLIHEYELRDKLDEVWAARPLDFVREGGRTTLILDDERGEPLDRLLTGPMEIGHFLRLAIGIAEAVERLHRSGLIHKDIKPANILVNAATDQVRLTGFGIASPLPRERQPVHPADTIAGTFAYMSPEQTGRMNRSIDSRSDLYALGITFYQMLAGTLPFTAEDPMEWVHCHLARWPVAPAERLGDIPDVVSDLVMKLLAKTAEHRYQTASGLVSDLRRCAHEWRAQRRIDDFSLGKHDTPDRLLIPEKLYGRQRDIGTLLAAFDRAVKGGAPELVLVSGYSGIGKSSLINELQPVLVPPRGLFASGKFDQHKLDVPYSTLAQAFESLIRPLLGKSEVELAPWRDAFREALGQNAALIVDLVPEIKLIIGVQPPAVELPPQDTQRRFHLVLRQFIGVFARPEHPLALFFDDLQWLDAATLDFLEDLLCRSNLHNLLLIGAYRDNEVTAAHPLMRKLDMMRPLGRIEEIKLNPLTVPDLGELVAASFHCEVERASSLAQLVHAKTNGNPFFAVQFLHVLADEGLLTFDHEQRQWTWDLTSISAKQYTDNVVEFLAPKLARLPPDTQNALRQLACLGNFAEVATLSMILEMPEEQMHGVLWEALRDQLIYRLDRSYRFAHDRVQEAAYAMIPRRSRASAHLKIGRLLASGIPPEERGEVIFNIVNQFDRAARLITTEPEREQVAELNLIAGKRANAAGASMAALRYLSAGRSLLGKAAWARNRRLVFEIELQLGECQYLVGRLAEAERRLSALSKRAQNPVDAGAVVSLRVNLYMVMDRSDDAVALGHAYLRRHQPRWRLNPTAEDVRKECGRLWRQIETLSIESLLDLPAMSDPNQQATMNVLTAVIGAAQFTDVNLFHLIIIHMAALSLEYGNTEGSCLAYAVLGSVPSPYPDQAQAGYRVGKIALELVEKRGFHRSRGITHYGFTLFIAHWIQPLATCQELFQRAFESARAVGDLTIASFARVDLVTNLLATGHPLEEVEDEANSALAFVQSVGFGQIGDVIVAQIRLIRALRGQTNDLNSFEDDEFRERSFEQRLEGDARLAIAASRYWIRKLQAKVHADDYVGAVEAASKSESLLWTLPSQQELPEYHFYTALAWAGHCEAAIPEGRHHALQELRSHHDRIAHWAESGPENFANRAALLGAELARLEGRENDAMQLYERAIRLAREQGFLHNEGLANELAARFWAARGFETIANAYFRNARDCYLRWGADGKVRQLDRLLPGLRPEHPIAGPTSTITTPVEHLDLATIIRVSQALSGEMVLETLIDRLMRSAIEHAGAERGLLISPESGELRIDAEATARGEVVVVRVPEQRTPGTAQMPETLIRYAIRTGETVILGDAAARNPFSGDVHIVQGHVHSVLCLPLVNQGKLIAVLYLENNLIRDVFTPDRVTVLKMLASQAAILLENTRLYRDLADREGKIRRLVDANILGICIWSDEDTIVEANEAFLRILHYERKDVVSGRLRWKDLTPAEWRERDERAMAELRANGTFQAFEKEFFRKDGGRTPVLLGGTRFEEGRNGGVAFVLDLTERKRAEEALRESERNLRSAIDGIPGLVAILAPNGEVEAVNRQIVYYCGRHLDELRSSGLGGIVHHDDLSRLLEIFTKSIASGVPYSIEARLRRFDGEFRWFDIRGIPVRDASERITRWYVLLTDVEDRTQALVRLQQMQSDFAHINRVSTMGELAASLSHEILHPIATARNNARAGMRFLEMDPPNLDEAREAIGCVVRDADRARDIVGRVRDHIKKAPSRKEPFDLNEAVREALAMVHSAFAKNKIAVTARLPEEQVPVQGDRVQLQQVIVNLVLNAVDAMGSGNERVNELTIRIEQGEADGVVLVKVADTGPGISPQNLERMFEPFYTTKDSGVGMGLSICRSIIKSHGGQLWAEPNKPFGALFLFTLPPPRDDS